MMDLYWISLLLSGVKPTYRILSWSSSNTEISACITPIRLVTSSDVDCSSFLFVNTGFPACVKTKN